MKKATTKSERKWGKDTSKNKAPKDDVVDEELYKILVDGSNFTKAMSYAKCEQVIAEYQETARKFKRPLPSLVMIKQ